MEKMEGLWLVLLTSFASVAVHGFKNFLSDPDLKFRNFATKIDGRRLNGSFFKEFNVTSEIFCQIECVADSRCSSYNLRPILGMEMFVCQLNQGDRFMGHQNFTDEDGAIYRGIQVSNKVRLRNIVIQLNLHVRPPSQNTKNLLSQSLIAETCRKRPPLVGDRDHFFCFSPSVSDHLTHVLLNSEVHCKNGPKGIYLWLSLLSTHLLLCLLVRSITTVLTITLEKSLGSIEYLASVTGTFIGELSSMVEREVPWYRYQVDPYFFQEHVILLLILTYSGTGKTSTFSFFLEHL